MKILMISDYDAPVGGIEQYIRDAAQLLSTDGYDVQIVWLMLPARILRHARTFLLHVTAFNIYLTIKLLCIILLKKPDLIRRHSVSRYVGRFPIWIVGLFGIRTWMMYHDLWYFHPYPSLLTDVSQVPKSWSLSSWLAAGRLVGRTSVINTIMMTLKFRSISAIRWALLRTVSIHLVPSPYMVPILESRWINIKNIQVLWHFGRIE
jgi:hypothetical protein